MEIDNQHDRLVEIIKLISDNKQLANNLITNTMKLNYDNREYWEYVLNLTELSDDFILDNLDKINLKYLLMYQKLSYNLLNHSSKFLKHMIENDLINVAVIHQTFSLNTLNNLIIDGFVDDEFWQLISKHQQLNGEFIKLYDDKIDWKLISIHQDLNMDIITEYLNKIDWTNIPLNITSGLLINDNTIQLYDKYPIWSNIAYLRNVTTDRLFDYFDKFDLNAILKILEHRQMNNTQLYQILEKYNDKIVWSYISEYQILLEEFVEKNADNLDWIKMSEFYDFSLSEIKKYSKFLSYKMIENNCNIDEELLPTIKDLIEK